MKAAELLSSYLESLRPIIYVSHFDFAAVDAMIEEAAAGCEIEEYNNASGRVHFKTKIDNKTKNPHKRNIGNPVVVDLCGYLSSFITDIPGKSRIIVLKDVHEQLADPAICACLEAIARRTMYEDGYWVPVIIVSSKLVIPPELEKLITVMDIPLPDTAEIEHLLADFARHYCFELPDDDRFELALSLKGLSGFEIEQILRLAYQQSGGITKEDKWLIVREKEQSIKKTGLLEAVRVTQRAEDIGGLERLVDYLKRKSRIYRNLSDAVKAHVDIPKGILIVGMPGCGKSLTAKAAAALFKTPLLRLDVGKLLGKYVGESEENLRQAIRIAEAAAPCVLWIDEVEKAFAGVGRDDGGGGVTTRLFGQFLTWMQEKDSMVYVVATANDITHIPPEFLRKGRFDEMFSVSLPNEDERRSIFQIHLDRRCPQWRKLGIDVNRLVKLTEGTKKDKKPEDTDQKPESSGKKPEYSGGDIESIVKTAVETAFEYGRLICQEDLELAVHNTIPIAKTLAKKIEKLEETMKDFQIQDASRRKDDDTEKIRKTAENGEDQYRKGEAQFQLAQRYEGGTFGLPKSKVFAGKWYLEAAKNGNQSAIEKLKKKT